MFNDPASQTVRALPQGFTARGAAETDLETAVALFNRWSQRVLGRDEVSFPHVILNAWQSAGFDPAEDIRLVFAPDGRLVGYIEVWTDANPPVHPWMWGRVDPEFQGRGIGTWLMHWAEARCLGELDRVPEGACFGPHVGAWRLDENAAQLFKDLGYSYVRTSYNMEIGMDEAPPAPLWPEGVKVRTFDPEKDMEAVYQALVDSFRDHFGFVEEPYEQGLEAFKQLNTGYEGFDPTLFFLAEEAGQIAGISLCPPCSLADPQSGWISSLGVRRPWRKRGLGLALLLHSFGEYYARGLRRVGLSVDADSLTGALRLYEKAGMKVKEALDHYERELRPGVEIRVESLNT